MEQEIRTFFMVTGDFFISICERILNVCNNMVMICILLERIIKKGIIIQ